jgi:hypothetical protein
MGGDRNPRESATVVEDKGWSLEEGRGVMMRRGELAVAEIRGIAEDSMTGDEGVAGEAGGMRASESCGVGVEGGCGKGLAEPTTDQLVP